jgi:hypothetical protein
VLPILRQLDGGSPLHLRKGRRLRCRQGADQFDPGATPVLVLELRNGNMVESILAGHLVWGRSDIISLSCGQRPAMRKHLIAVPRLGFSFILYDEDH